MIRHLIRSSSRPMAGHDPILPMPPAEARALEHIFFAIVMAAFAIGLAAWLDFLGGAQ